MQKILVVDDDEGILDAVSLILETQYIVKTIIKGEEVYEQVGKFKPDLILLDILMSGSDGRVICKKLKENPKSTKIPIVMMSAHPAVEKQALDFGASSFIAKPFNSEELFAIIRKYLK